MVVICDTANNGAGVINKYDKSQSAQTSNKGDHFVTNEDLEQDWLVYEFATEGFSAMLFIIRMPVLTQLAATSGGGLLTTEIDISKTINE